MLSKENYSVSSLRLLDQTDHRTVGNAVVFQSASSTASDLATSIREYQVRKVVLGLL